MHHLKELFRLDPGLDHTLRPVSASGRYAILTDPERIQMLSCKEGDVVRLSGGNNAKWNGELGIVQYIGPISNSTEICITENLTWTDSSTKILTLLLSHYKNVWKNRFLKESRPKCGNFQKNFLSNFV